MLTFRFCKARNALHSNVFPVAVVIEVVLTIAICLIAFCVLKFVRGHNERSMDLTSESAIQRLAAMSNARFSTRRAVLTFKGIY